MHVEVTRLMSALLDGEAAGAEVQQLHQHMAGCAQCADVWRQMQALDRLCVSSGELTPPSAFVARTGARLARRQALAQRRARLRSDLLLAALGLADLLWVCLAVLAAWPKLGLEDVTGLLSVTAQVFFGAGWSYQVLARLVESLGGLPLAFAACGYLTLTLCVGLVWIWLVVRSPGWVRADAKSSIATSCD